MSVAVFEFPARKNKKVSWRSFGHLVIWSKSFSKCQNPPLYINILIFIYSEQMTESENENDHFDHDQNDHAFGEPVLSNKRLLEIEEYTRGCAYF